MSKFLSQIYESYRLGFLFCAAAFPLFCLPVVFEGVQHIAEVKLGMFAAQGAADFGPEQQNIRLGFGVLKVLSLLAVFIYLPRYFIHGKDLKRTLQFTPSAKKSLVIGFAVMIGVFIWYFLIGPPAVTLIMPEATQMQRALLPLVLVLLIGFPMQSKMNGWMARVFDDAPVSEAENKALNKAMIGGCSPVILLAFLPMMVLHYYLNTISMGAAPVALYMLLGLDSVVVGVLAALMGASYYIVYRDARKGL